jgi:DNA mismatch repair protein MutL
MGIETNRIHVLSPSVANQIAAGEVIERPASVVKELLENALDAGATAMVIDIGFGGLNQVKISDNGAGIVADDLPLAVAAHATSKMDTLTDLYTIHSMGFRGEALASIASVSRLSICSRPAAQAHGTLLCIEPGGVTLAPAARSQGTTVDVRDIFFNAPVRKKFLKTERNEYQAIEMVVKRFALSAPEVALTLNHNGKQMLALPAVQCEQSRLARIQKLLGKTFVEQAIYLETERSGMCLQGWVSRQSYQRSQNDRQWIYVNRRMVRDKLLQHALKQAYEGQLHPGRHPACILYLSIPPDQVDVNVHPTKHELRFQQPRLVHDLMTSQVLKALGACWEVREGFCLPRAGGDPSFVSEANPGRYGSPPARGRQPGDFMSTHPWLVLNTHFAIVHDSNEPWLLNVELLQRHRLKILLSQQTFPLVSRPLLVPISYTFDRKNQGLMERMLPVLEKVGMHCDFVSETRLMVRTIPQCLPALDIQQCLQALGKELQGVDDVLAILVACQTVDVLQWSQDEKMELMAFMQTTPDAWSQYGIRMDLAACRGLLHG